MEPFVYHAQPQRVIFGSATLAGTGEETTMAFLTPIPDALGAESAATGIYDLEVGLGAPPALADIGMPKSGLAKAYDEIVSSPYWNPRPVEPNGVLRQFEDAFAGRRPAS